MTAVARRDDLAIAVELRPGDLVAFDNRRVLHGRDAFREHDGGVERWLRGCYSERDELRSRRRILDRVAARPIDAHGDTAFTSRGKTPIVGAVYGRGVRCRWLSSTGGWAVRARVERIVEPALLLLLDERPRHGYDLLENIPALVGHGGADVDLSNLYRLLRGLEGKAS